LPVGSAVEAPEVGLSDSLLSIAAIEALYEKQAVLFHRVTLTVQRFPGRYGGAVTVQADRFRYTVGDSTTVQYFVSFDADGLNESIPENEVPSLVTGLDSLIRLNSEAGLPGTTQQLSYTVSTGARIGILNGSSPDRTVYVAGTGRTAFLSVPQLPALRGAILAARDSLARLKSHP